jgi:hypothetical protein
VLKALWEGWRRVARKIGEFQSKLVLTLFYYVVLAPFALAVRARDPLDLRGKTSWHKLKPEAASSDPLTSLAQQF